MNSTKQWVDNGARLLDPAFYAGDPYPVYDRLRRQQPVFWFEPGQCWVVSRYEDIRAVSRAADVFSVEQGMVIGDNLKPDRGRGLLPPDCEGLLTTDPPRHTQLRRLVSRAFSPRVMADLEPRIREITAAVLDECVTGDVVDFVSAVAEPVPLFVIAELLGLPQSDRESLTRWTDAIFDFLGKNVVQSGGGREPSAAENEWMAYQATQLFEMWAYFTEKIEERRRAPGDDLISALLAVDIDGEQLSDMNLLMFAMTLLAAGNETTRNVISGGLLALIQHPEQRAALLERPELVRTAADEFLRWVSPVLSAGRTALTRTEISGQVIEAGDYVIMLYQSSHRDPEIFEDPDHFNVSREANPHLAFGFGEHLCLGASLARHEIRTVFEQLLARFPNIELAGTPKRLDSIFVSSLKSLPVALG